MPKAIDKKIREKAKKLHCVDGKSLSDVAEELSLDLSVIKSWHNRDNWTQIKKESAIKLQDKLVDLKVQYDFDVIKEYIDSVIELKKLGKDSETLEANALFNTKQKYLSDLAKIEQKLTEKVKHEGTVQVIPLLGGDSVKK